MRGKRLCRTKLNLRTASAKISAGLKTCPFPFPKVLIIHLNRTMGNDPSRPQPPTAEMQESDQMPGDAGSGGEEMDHGEDGQAAPVAAGHGDTYISQQRHSDEPTYASSQTGRWSEQMEIDDDRQQTPEPVQVSSFASSEQEAEIPQQESDGRPTYAPSSAGSQGEDAEMDDNRHGTPEPWQVSSFATPGREVHIAVQASSDKPAYSPSSAGQVIAEKQEMILPVRLKHIGSHNGRPDIPERASVNQPAYAPPSVSDAVIAEQEMMPASKKRRADAQGGGLSIPVRGRDNEPVHAPSSADDGARENGTPAPSRGNLDHKAIARDPRPYLETWERHRPLIKAEPDWTLSQVERNKLPPQVQTAMKQLTSDGPGIWRKIRGKDIDTDYNKLARPAWIEQLRDDVEALRKLKPDLADHPKALQFVRQKEDLAADCMYAFAECVGRRPKDEPLLFMMDEFRRRPWARLTDQDLKNARQALRDEKFTWQQRREMFESEYDQVVDRFDVAMQKAFP